MPLTSMTGFAEARGAHGTLRWRWEDNSVNGRGLDVRLRRRRATRGWKAARARSPRERFKRGSLQVVLTGGQPRKAAAAFASTPWRSPTPCRIAKRVADETGLAPARVDGMLALKGVVVQDESRGARR